LQALALAERFAQQDLGKARDGGDDVYFDVLSYFVLRYPQTWAPWIAAIVSILVAMLLGLGLRNGSTSIGRIVLSFAVLALNVAMVSGLCWCLLWSMRRVALNQYPNWTIAGFAMLACAITVAVIYAVPKLSSLDLAAGGLVIWMMLTLLTGFASRGYSYLTAWPLLFCAMGFAWAIFSSRQTGLLRTLILALCAVPAALLLPRVIYLAFLGLKINGVITLGASKINIGVTPILVIPIVLALWLLALQVGPAEALLPQPPDAA
jgi:hypothetical protein